MRIKKLGSVMLLCALLAQLSAPALAAGETETLYINDAADLLRIAELCAYDVWSEGKTVVLQRDISLGDMDFTPIPSFGGSFVGGGHVISGVNVTQSVAPAGLFGVIAETGVVQDLTVEGSVIPGGSAKRVGGVAGENRGTLVNCAFTGTVEGEEQVGGIVGVNAATGVLRRCQTGGGVFGKSMTGGVAGENHGTLSFCVNRAYVNTNTLDPSLSFDSLEAGMTEGLSGLVSPETFNVTVDSGGIAGHTDGTVLGSVNYGSVGYQHVGYNVGGVAGRSSGHLSACTNQGSVFGRREVGGVVGMAEPYVKIELRDSSIDEVRQELRALSAAVNKTVDDASGASEDISARLSAINRGVDEAEAHTRTLAGHVTDAYDDTITEINRGSDILDAAIAQM